MIIDYTDKLMDIVNVSLPSKDWKLICSTLREYTKVRREELSTMNVGDREWEEVNHINSIANDLEYYVIADYKSFDR